ncbi:hypothetical protein BGZ94_000982 [Podila epigama]|nr:hypothetical protein BGZ94_000982 [Podila epigama]
MAVRHYLSKVKAPLLPTEQSPSSPSTPFMARRGCSSLSCKHTTFLLIAITSAILLINTAQIQYTLTPTPSAHPPDSAASILDHKHTYPSFYNQTHSLETKPTTSTSTTTNDDDDDDDDYQDDEQWQFTEPLDGDEAQVEDPDQTEQPILTLTTSSSLRNHPNNHPAPAGIVSPHCPSLFFSTEPSFSPPSFASSSTVQHPSLAFPSSSPDSSTTLLPGQVSCQPIQSLLPEYHLAFCISNQDCSRGFIQIIHTVAEDDSVWRINPSRNQVHGKYFREIAGPDDFYFLIQGAQRLAFGAQLVSKDLLVSGSSGLPDAIASEDSFLVYRADFHMTLPGPVQLSGWLTYEKFRAVREDQPGIWPQWTHAALIQQDTSVDSPSSGSSSSSSQLTICPACEINSFLEQAKMYRDSSFEQCDRMVPTRGAYWSESLALRIYSDLDTVNKAPGAGGIALSKAAAKNRHNKKPPLFVTKGWRFVPNGCTMTATPRHPYAASANPFHPTCDSIASPTSQLLSPKFSGQETDRDHDNLVKRAENPDQDFPHRRILFTGDSQVRATYNAILNHYRPVGARRQRFSSHGEFLPSEDTLALNSTLYGSEPEDAAAAGQHERTGIEIVYKADQFLDGLVGASDDYLDKFDTIYVNLGQWPASGPTAGGQWSTAQFLERWELVLRRLKRWKDSRDARMVAQAENSNGKPSRYVRVLNGSGASSRVIWAGQNAFPMRTDDDIRTKGDWRTNARLGYWDDWIETISRKEGSWLRRMNSWQLTFPMVDEVVDRAHYQETDAIDALKLEALYKLDLCSKMTPDQLYA